MTKANSKNDGSPSRAFARIAAIVAAFTVTAAVLAAVAWPKARLSPATASHSSAFPCPAGMAHVPGGAVRLVFEGVRWIDAPERTAFVRPFCVDRFEASRPQPDAVEADGVSPARSIPDAIPWTSVTYDEAKRACEKSGKRLPTWAEWQTAFSGPRGWAWPWGETWTANDCAVGQPGDPEPRPTGQCCFRVCDPDTGECSSDTICDMVGNVSEWIAEPWDEACYGADVRALAGGAIHIDADRPTKQDADPNRPGCYTWVSYGQSRGSLHHHPGRPGADDPTDDDGFRCVMDAPAP